MNFKANKDKQLLYGPFLIPNMLIYRKDDKNGEYYVRFSAEQIEKIAEKFNSDSNHNNTNFMHTDEKVDGFVYQNWIIEGEGDKSKNFNFDLPEGTWFGAVKIKDEKFWNEKVKSNEVNGFSVEILADLELQLKNKKEKMENEIELGSTMLGDGKTPIYYSDDAIKVGSKIFTDEDMSMLAPNDRWLLEDGRTIVVVDGEVTAIEEEKKEEEVETAEHDKPMNNQMTAEEVSMMIDSRFNEIMEEITRLKSMMKDEEKKNTDYKKQIDEKFSSVPAAGSIKKPEFKLDEKFRQSEERIKQFARK